MDVFLNQDFLIKFKTIKSKSHAQEYHNPETCDLDSNMRPKRILFNYKTNGNAKKNYSKLCL